jgi:uncharacterized protein with PIN domain
LAVLLGEEDAQFYADAIEQAVDPRMSAVSGSYGRGRHPAGLNLGDCCSYGWAKVTDKAPAL